MARGLVRGNGITVLGGIWEIVPAGDRTFEARGQTTGRLNPMKETTPQRIVVRMAWVGVIGAGAGPSTRGEGENEALGKRLRSNHVM